MSSVSNIQSFTPTGWIAIFTGTDTLVGRSIEVDAWDTSTGTALVVDAERGVRRLVTDYPDFSHLERANRVVAALPGAGWRVRDLYWGQEKSPVEEVLAWLVKSNGELTAITVDKNGNFGSAEDAHWCYPPGVEPDQ